MNITLFFGFIFSVLLAIYVFFQPLEIKQQKFTEIPLFELSGFALYELDGQGLKTILLGDSSKRFSDRYTVDGINYTDNSKEYIANMKAKKGLYKGDDISLEGDVVYNREDGLIFESQEAQYNKKSTILSTDKAFIVYRGKESVKGSSFVYDNTQKKLSSKNIEAIYQLEESTK
ncbi:MAG: LPS export ABC transporter periplasmic protein LptC [Campylobacterales bacterium]|nr:LPS export ABC transporter periplasmic protein LptC [Campylobacterales bacterium]